MVSVSPVYFFRLGRNGGKEGCVWVFSLLRPDFRNDPVSFASTGNRPCYAGCGESMVCGIFQHCLTFQVPFPPEPLCLIPFRIKGLVMVYTMAVRIASCDYGSMGRICVGRVDAFHISRHRIIEEDFTEIWIFQKKGKVSILQRVDADDQGLVLHLAFPPILLPEKIHWGSSCITAMPRTMARHVLNAPDPLARASDIWSDTR